VAAREGEDIESNDRLTANPKYVGNDIALKAKSSGALRLGLRAYRFVALEQTNPMASGSRSRHAYWSILSINQADETIKE
jgi:hypothetical protein